MEENIKVFVRARAFTAAELNSQESLVVSQISPEKVSLLLPERSAIDYNFNQFLWSVDDFTKDDKGTLIPTSGKYADQKMMFDLIKPDIISSLNSGFNYCLFAYGQTGSGKSYSISGNKANPGLLYNFFDLVFEETKKYENSNINVSMYQIYREEIFDLFESKPVRRSIEGSGKNIKIKDLKKVNVICLSQVTELYEKGLRLRATEATQMNQTSSRSHCDFVTTVSIDGKISTFHIIDLAGSERIEKSNLSGDRLREGIKINLSLFTLGMVINQIIDKQKTISFRNSILTQLLQNSLRGSSKTSVIVAISPSLKNISETKSSLDFAKNLMRVTNKVVTNLADSDNINIIRREFDKIKEENLNLTQENTVLRKERVMYQEQLQKRIEEIEEQKRQELKSIEDAARKYKKLVSKTSFLLKVDKNEKSFKYLMTQNENIITCKESSNLLKIAIPFNGILKNHCIILKESEKFYVDSEFFKDIRVNGKEVIEKVEIQHGDRLILGNINYFVFINPSIGENNTSFNEILEERYIDDLEMLLSDPEVSEIADKIPEFKEKYLKYRFKVAWANEASERIGENLNFELFFDKNEKKFIVKVCEDKYIWDLDYFKIQMQKYLFDFKIFEEDEEKYFEQIKETLEKSKKKLQKTSEKCKKQQENISKLFKVFENYKEELEKKKKLYENYIEINDKEVIKLSAEKADQEIISSDEDRQKLEETLQMHEAECSKYENFCVIANSSIENIEKITLESKRIIEWPDVSQKDFKLQRLVESVMSALTTSRDLLIFVWEKERIDEKAQLFDNIKANLDISERRMLKILESLG